MSATYTTDSGHQASVTEYLHHDTARDIVWAVIATDAADQGMLIVDALRNHPL
jgi:hypothetical protein